MPHEAISVFEIFKIGVGPSSSHTLGPWRAAERFWNYLLEGDSLDKILSIKVMLYGSLAKTGKGHGTDIAVMLGLNGEDPVKFSVDQLTEKIAEINEQKEIWLGGKKKIVFDPLSDIVFLKNETLPYHPNALTFLAELSDADHIAQTYYSGNGAAKRGY